jgi:hypothetical protein
MALTTATDLVTLSSRSFLTDYANNKQAFVGVGKIVYQALQTHGGSAPGQTNLEQPLGVALQSATVFKTVCHAKPHASQVFYPTYAFALARYMIDNDWSDITTP